MLLFLLRQLGQYFPTPLLLAFNLFSTAMPSHAMSIVDVKNAHRINIPKNPKIIQFAYIIVRGLLE